jgi:hypothetical protein
LAWTGDPEISRTLTLVLPILVAGSALNALNHIPYALQLANGWTSLEIKTTAIAVVVLGPLLPLLTWKYGVAGAALVWLLYNFGASFIAVPVMHRTLLVQEQREWYLFDLGRPLLAALGIGLTARVLLPRGMSQFELVAALAIVGLLALLAALAVSPEVRSDVRSFSFAKSRLAEL